MPDSMPLTSRERSSPSPPAPPHFPALPIGLASCLAVTVVRLERLGHPPSTSDLAYMMAVHWYPERRQRLERALLDHYHTVLLENGVRSYNRIDMQDDYRRSVLWQTATPVFQAGLKLPPMIWWNNFQRIMAAVDDLGCRELLD